MSENKNPVREYIDTETYWERKGNSLYLVDESSSEIISEVYTSDSDGLHHTFKPERRFFSIESARLEAQSVLEKKKLLNSLLDSIWKTS